MLIHVGYRRAPQDTLPLNNDSSSLESALSFKYESCSGIISQELYEQYKSFLAPYSTFVNTNFIECDADRIPARTPLHGAISISLTKDHTHRVFFSFAQNTETFLAPVKYTDARDLLLDLYADFNKDLRQVHVQKYVGDKLAALLDELYLDVVNPDLETRLNYYASQLIELFSPYADQLACISFKQRGPSEFLPEAGFAWRSETPLIWNVLSLLYYVTQGFSYFKKFPVLLWSATPPKVLLNPSISQAASKYLRFLHTRNLELSNQPPGQFHASNSLLPRSEKDHVPFPSLVATPARINKIKETNVQNSRLLTPAVLNLVWNISVIFESVQLFSTHPIEWSYSCILNFMNDTLFREQVLQSIPLNRLGFDSPLDQAIQYIEYGEFAKDQLSSTPSDALFILRWYFNVERALSNNLTRYSHPVIDWKLVQERHVHAKKDNDKKFLEYYDHLNNTGVFRFFSPNVIASALEPLYRDYPNFSSVTSWIAKILTLADHSVQKILHIPPILLVGPPGLGKTRYLNALARILTPFVHEFSMSTMSASFIFAGSDSTWRSAKVGQIADILILNDCINPIIILDEIDKGLLTDYSPYGSLFSLLEKHTASRFKDEYLNFSVDASHINWFSTANHLDPIPEPIRNRFRVFEIPALRKEDILSVSQSVYNDILSTNGWGSIFSPELTSDVMQALLQLDVRAMRFSLLEACANAVSRYSDELLILKKEDIPAIRPSRSIGFCA